MAVPDRPHPSSPPDQPLPREQAKAADLAGPLMERIPLDHIVVEGRFRDDLGDLDDLQASIAQLGLLCAIAVDRHRRLIHGHRRLQACRQLGWTDVPVVVLTHLDDALARYRAERDENTCRLEMNASELTKLGRAIEALERPGAEGRQVESRAKPGQQIRRSLGGGRAAPTYKPDRPGRTVEKVSQALGISATTYKRRRRLVIDADDQTLPGWQRTAAREAVAEMDRTGKTAPAYDHYRQRIAAGPSATDGVEGGSGSPDTGPISGLVLSLMSLEGLCSQLDKYPADHEFPADDAGLMLASLRHCLPCLTRFKRRLEKQQ